jgi:uncharacterized protein (TIGR00730 family)
MSNPILNRGAEPAAQDVWRIFRIMAEFVDGFETMAQVGPAVSVFGSARTKPTDRYYQLAIDMGQELSKRGFAVITGGGPGIMEAAHKGAHEAGGVAVGLNISLPQEQKANPFQSVSLNHHYFFVRKVMFVKYSHAFVCFPGGFGTMDEFFESLTLIQTLKIDPFPVLLMGSDFWTGLIEWMRETILDRFQAIHGDDLNLFRITDSPEEAADVIAKYEATRSSAQPGDKLKARSQQVSAEGTRYGLAPKFTAAQPDTTNGNGGAQAARNADAKPQQ